jgi:molecular chaperone DnaJ
MISFDPKNKKIRKSRVWVVLLGMIVGRFAFPGILGWWPFWRPRRPRAGPDIVMDLEIELVEAARGCSRTIELNRHERCAECGGFGWRSGTSPPHCKQCGGRGEIIRLRRFVPVATECPTCQGRGLTIIDPCLDCRGQGLTPNVATLIIDVPAGVESGMWLQLRQQGEPGELGAPRGNLRIHLLVKPHPRFDRRHNDLYCKIAVAVADAAVKGETEVEVPTLDGTCSLRVPPGTRNGDFLRIPGCGMPDISGSGHGDIVVQVVLEKPGN